MAGVFTEALMGALAAIWLMRWVIYRDAVTGQRRG